MAEEELVAIAEELYAGPVEAFTETRNAAAKQVADKQLAARVKALRKPSVAAWAVNLLVRREGEQIDSVLVLAEQLRAAAQALDGEELRSLTRQRRQLTSVLATTARSHARDAGVRLTEPVVAQVEGILTAAMLDPVAAQVVRTGRVLNAFTSTGVSELDVESVVAVPEALDAVARLVQAPEPGPPDLHVVHDDSAVRAAAEEDLEQATQAVDAAESELAEGEAAVERLSARRLQLQGEAEELRRRVAALEEQVDEVDDDLEDAEEAVEESRAVLHEARRSRESAQEALDRLTR